MEEKVIKVFDKLNIEYELIHHERIYKSSDRAGKDVDFKGAKCCKNLLVKEQKGENKGKLYLVSLTVDKRANLREIEGKLNISRLTFATEDEMIENLGIKSGNASILNIIEKPHTNVTFVIDNNLLEYEKVAFHPNDNSMSIAFIPKHIEDILKEYNAKYCYIDF